MEEKQPAQKNYCTVFLIDQANDNRRAETAAPYNLLDQTSKLNQQMGLSTPEDYASETEEDSDVS